MLQLLSIVANLLRILLLCCMNCERLNFLCVSSCDFMMLRTFFSLNIIALGFQGGIEPR